MPLESTIVVGFVIAAFMTFGVTLAVVAHWYQKG